MFALESRNVFASSRIEYYGFISQLIARELHNASLSFFFLCSVRSPLEVTSYLFTVMHHKWLLSSSLSRSLTCCCLIWPCLDYELFPVKRRIARDFKQRSLGIGTCFSKFEALSSSKLCVAFHSNVLLVKYSAFMTYACSFIFYC